MIPINQKRVNKGMYWMRALSLVEGCTPVSEGCANCWSMDATHTRAGQKNPKIRARYGGLTTEAGKWTGEIRLMEDSLSLPLSVKKPTTWAVWNDLFHEDVCLGFVEKVYLVMRETPQHTYLILTKRPERMKTAMEIMRQTWEGGVNGSPLPNIGIGTTVENQAAADARIPHLLQTPAAWRWLSLEPVLGEIDLRFYLITNNSLFKARRHAGEGNYRGERQEDGSIVAVCSDGTKFYDGIDLNWLTIGAETGHHRRPCDLAHVESLVAQATSAGVPVFVKALDLGGRVSKDMREWPEHLRRREFPNGKS